MVAPGAADRAALDAVAAGESTPWRVSGSGVELLIGGRPAAAAVQAWRRPAVERNLPPPRLRFDRVALRVCAQLRAAAAPLLPPDRLGFVTIRAPIRLASKTVAAVGATMRDTAVRRPRTAIVHENRVCVGVLPAPRSPHSGLVCFIHTHDTDAARLLAMTRDLLALVEPARHASTYLVIRTTERASALPAYRHILEQLAIDVPYRQVFMAFGDGRSGRLLD